MAIGTSPSFVPGSSARKNPFSLPDFYLKLGQDSPILLRQLCLIEKIRPSLEGSPEGFSSSPDTDQRVIPRHQYLGHLLVFENPRPRVMGVLQETVLKSILQI